MEGPGLSVLLGHKATGRIGLRRFGSCGTLRRLKAAMSLGSGMPPSLIASRALSYDQPFVRVSRHTKDENEVARK